MIHNKQESVEAVGEPHDSLLSADPVSPVRRKTIKAMAAGAGALVGTTLIPDKWVPPLIQGITLPAHAQTSMQHRHYTFSDDRVEIKLVEGHGGRSEMAFEASGCIQPATADIEIEFTLEAYTEPLITEGRPDNILQSFRFGPSEAHAGALMPRCTVTIRVRPDAFGNFTVLFKMTCGPGIVQVVLHALFATGQRVANCGLLDVHSCNPCGTAEPAGKTKHRHCGRLTASTDITITNMREDVVIVSMKDGREGKLKTKQSMQAVFGDIRFIYVSNGESRKLAFVTPSCTVDRTSGTEVLGAESRLLAELAGQPYDVLTVF